MNLFVLLYFWNSVTAVKHSLDYVSTTTSGITEFPEFVGLALVDNVFVGSCTTVINKTEPKNAVIKKFLEENPDQLQWYITQCQEKEKTHTGIINGLKKHSNQSAGKHVFQQYSGCEWDDETGKTKGFSQYTYDGEDFLKLDLQKHEWTALTDKALVTKLNWEKTMVGLKHSEYFYTIQCPDWLKKYVAYGTEYLHRTVFPSVSLLEKSSSSLISCHATGFFPDTADLFWMKDGEEFHEDVEKGEILPNDDETFQMSIHLNTSSITPEDWKHFSCVFQLYGSQENITLRLEENKIRTNHVRYTIGTNTGSSSRIHWGAGAAVVFIVVGMAIWIFVWKRRNNNPHVDEEPMI